MIPHNFHMLPEWQGLAAIAISNEAECRMAAVERENMLYARSFKHTHKRHITLVEKK